ncbi:Uncharacterised protein [Mycobacteroides abscessus subsp. abscessus]|nr:Uncharacterised protein [Mycobacteroides abscessus subsp. abscessus]
MIKTINTNTPAATPIPVLPYSQIFSTTAVAPSI